MKRRHNIPKAGIFINRIHGDSVKDKLVKDIYTPYCFGEGNTKTLPKSLLKAPELAQKSAQTDIESEQISLLKSLVKKTYATKYELKSLRDNLTLEISKLRQDIMLTTKGMLHSQSLPDSVSPSLAVPSSSRPSTLHSIPEYSVSVPNTAESNIPSIDRRIVTPQSLIDQLVDHIAVLKEFCNVKNIFVCKITPRCDRHVINSKFSEYNKLLDEHFSSQDSLTVLPTIPLEASLLYKDNLHLSVKGLCQVSGIILSNLYQVLAPNSYKPGLGRKSKPGRNAKSSNKAQNHKY